MSTRFSGQLNIAVVPVVISPYEIEAVFTDLRGFYTEAQISVGNVIIDANQNRYKVTSIISLSPLVLRVVFDDLGAPSQPSVGLGIIGQASACLLYTSDAADE